MIIDHQVWPIDAKDSNDCDCWETLNPYSIFQIGNIYSSFPIITFKKVMYHIANVNTQAKNNMFILFLQKQLLLPLITIIIRSAGNLIITLYYFERFLQTDFWILLTKLHSFFCYSFGKSKNLSKIFFAEILVFDNDYEGKSLSSNGVL